MIFLERLILVITVPMILLVLQWYLCKREFKFAIVLPAIVACFYLLFGLKLIGVSAIMLLIYVVMTYVLEEKKKITSEIEKMTIQDLE